MKPRLDFLSTTPNVVKAMLGLHKPLAQSGLEKRLLDLMYFRVSQINGCAFCLDMHSKDLRAGGETEQRLYVLEAWRESPFYSDRERAALAWAEAVTTLRQRCSRRRLRAGQSTVQRSRVGESDFGRDSHQRLESTQYRFSHDAGHLRSWHVFRRVEAPFMFRVQALACSSRHTTLKLESGDDS